MKRFISFLTAVSFVFFFASCGVNTQKDNSVQIISSVFPSYDFTRQIIKGVDGVEVSMLITPGTEPHSYEPSVPDMAKIKECDLFIYLGGESDQWVNALIDTFDDKEINTLRMIECVDTLESQTVEGMQGAEHHHHKHEGHHHHEQDEHVWTSPLNAIKISEEIKNKLVSLDAENAHKYQHNFNNYKAELLKLHNEFDSILSADSTFVIADRFPFRYLAEEYGFNYYAAFPGCSTESDPSASTIAFLETKTNEIKTNAVFYTEFSSQKVADTLCEATDVKKLLIHSCHNVDRDDFNNGVTYVSLMKQNIKNFQEALK